MTIQLTGQSERFQEIFSSRVPEPHRVFRGLFSEQMSLLVSGKNRFGDVDDVPRKPASLAYILERRMDAPEDVREAWQENWFHTGDASVAGTEGDHLIVLDAQALRDITQETELYQENDIVLSPDTWQELKEEIRKDSLKGVYLTAQEARDAHYHGGYRKKNGVWIPECMSGAKVWNTLSRGRDLNLYLQNFNEKHPGKLYEYAFSLDLFNPHISKPIMRPFCTPCIGSGASTHYGLQLNNSALIGVAPITCVVRDKDKLEQLEKKVAQFDKIQSALKLQKPFEYNGKVYGPICDIPIKT